MFFGSFGQFNNNFFNFGFNNMFFPQPFFFNNFMPFQMPIFTPPMFNFMPNFQTQFNIWDSSIPEFSFNPTFSYKPNFSTQAQTTNLDTFERSNSELNSYDYAKGNLMVNIAKSRAVGNVGYCAKFVQETISLAGLGTCTGANAYEMANILRRNPNFKEISTQNTDVSKLPAGCIVVYDKCTRHPDEIYGHVEFTVGDGRGVSDGVSSKLNPNPSAIFIPV